MIYQIAEIAFWVFAIAGCISGVFVVAGVLAHIFRGPLNRLANTLIRD